MGCTGAELLARIRAGLIGEGEVLPGPYGPRRLTYADHTASGRALDLVEDAIRDRVLPACANTHSESSARGGCSCAGPYGHRLLCITPRRSAAQVARGHLRIKPGWARIAFTYFMSEAVVDFLIDAVDLVATDGYRLLGDYRADPGSGRWRLRDAPVAPAVRLGDLLLGPAPVRETLGEQALLPGHLERARALLTARPAGLADRPSGLPAELEAPRDFHLPAGCLPGGPA